MRITMLQTRSGGSLGILVVGTTYTVPDGFGAQMIGSGWATDTDRFLVPLPSSLTPAAAAAAQAAFDTGGFLAATPMLIANSKVLVTRSSVNTAADNAYGTLFSFLIPGGSMGPNGTLHWEVETSYTDVATNATTLAFTLRIEAVAIAPEYNVSTGTNDNRGHAWHNTAVGAQKYRGSYVRQSGSAVGFTTTAIDTSLDQAVDFVCRWSGATLSEVARLESIRAWIEYGA